MTLPAPELPTMRQDMSGLINDWGSICVVKRRNQAIRNAAGMVSAPFSTVGSDTMWIQPISSTRAIFQSGVKEFGILDKTTHMCFSRFAGPSVQNSDQITAAGETYAYDVLSSQLLSTHRLIYLQQVKRS